MSQSLLFSLSMQERIILMNSVKDLKKNIESLVENFYKYLLEDNKEIQILFKNTDMIKQRSMFNVSIGIIISNVENTEFVKEHLDILVKRHREYGVESFHVDDFLNAYLKAIKNVFENYNQIVDVWTKIIKSTMVYFKNEMMKLES